MSERRLRRTAANVLAELWYRIMPPKPPKEPRWIQDSELYMQDPELAKQLWRQGYRPKFAMNCLAGMGVTYCAEFGGFEFGPVRYGKLTEVKQFEGTIMMHHDGHPDPVEVDELDEVWVNVSMMDEF